MRWIGLASALALAACSSDGGGSSGGAPVPDGGVRTDSGKILPPGAPIETTKCPLVTASAGCTVPADLTGVGLGSAWATTDESCKTKLYVAKITDDTKYSLARYSLTSATPCALEPDAAFSAGEPGDFLAADDTGKVYTAKQGSVMRIAPLPAVACEGVLGPDLAPTAITMKRDGMIGWVGFAKLVDGNAVERLLGKLEPTATGCKITQVKLTGDTIKGSIDGLAIDSKGRVHVVDHGAKNEDRVGIFEASGAFVNDYRTGAKGEPLKAVRGITPCRGGLCVEDFGTAVAVDENGMYRAETVYAPSEATSAHVFVGTVRGPFFAVASVNGAKKIVVDLLAEHE